MLMQNIILFPWDTNSFINDKWMDHKMPKKLLEMKGSRKLGLLYVFANLFKAITIG